MAEDEYRPILRPVLRSLDDPTPRLTRDGGKSRYQIKEERIEEQRSVLSENFITMANSVHLQPKFDNSVIVYADMFDDSFAPSYTPRDIFGRDRDIFFTLPYQGGYLLQVRSDKLKNIAEKIKNTTRVCDKVDISRVKNARFFNEKDALGYRDIDELWTNAPKSDNGRLFIVHLMRFRTRDAVINLIEKFKYFRRNSVVISPRALSEDAHLRSIDRLLENVQIEVFGDLLEEARSGDRIALALLQYSINNSANTTILVPSVDKLNELLVSGSVLRIDPSFSISVSVSESNFAKSQNLPSDIKKYPLVGIVDGGLKSNKYQEAVEWEHPKKLISDKYAAKKHGTQVASLIVHGHHYNSSLTVPKLYCKIGVGQAILEEKTQCPGALALPSENTDPGRLSSYIEDLVQDYRETRVWNFSFNMPNQCDSYTIDSFSHDIADIARRYNILPIVSIGNEGGLLLHPPADCEAAITVGGRLSNDVGEPGERDNSCSKGPGPSGMLKPEISNFSHINDYSGKPDNGSSFSAALTSPLAAHAMEKVRDASPDMVKALLIHRTDLNKFDPYLGFGTPSVYPLPWECRKGTATLIWNLSLRQGSKFDWKFSIPGSLLKTGKLKGNCDFTAILNPYPFISTQAEMNYFSVRFEAGLQVQRYVNSDGRIKNFSLVESSMVKFTEKHLREKFNKWSPTKNVKKSFDIDVLHGCVGFRVHARIYTRDAYLYEGSESEEADSFELAFVLSIGTGDKNDDVYGELVNILGNKVRPAVL